MKNSPVPEHYFDDVPKSVFFSMLFLLFAGAALLMSLLYKERSLAIFSLIILLLSITFRIWSRLSLKEILYSADVDKSRVFPGDRINLKIRLENNKWLPVVVKLRLSIAGLRASEGDEAVVSEQSGLLWHQKLEIHKELRPGKRGLYQTGSPRLVTGDLFGFFPRTRNIRHHVDITVFPRLVPLRPFPVLKRIMFGKPAAASPLRDPVYILGTRNYQDLSPSRNIHWKASARHGKLQEKIFEPTEQEKVLLILDAEGFYENQAEENFEQAIETLASLAVDLDLGQFAVGFLTNSRILGGDSCHLAINSAAGHVSSLLDRLAKIQLQPDVKMDRLLKTRHYFPVGISCVYFSYQLQNTVSALHERRIPVVNIVADRDARHRVLCNESCPAIRYSYLDDIRQVSLYEDNQGTRIESPN